MRKAIALGILLLSLAVGLLVIAWWQNEWDLEATAWIGDTAAPIVGVLSLFAVGAALWSVRLQTVALASQELQIAEQQRAMTNELGIQNEALALQRQALAKQDEQIKQQQDALTAQLDLQRLALAKQDEQIKHQQESLATQLDLQRLALAKQDEEIKRQAEALDRQFHHQRLATLREAYGPFLAATRRYIDAIHEYQEWMIRTDFREDSPTRASHQAPIRDAMREMENAIQVVQLVDFDEQRGGLRWGLIRSRLLEPVIDTTDNQRAYGDVIYHKTCELLVNLSDLKEHLGREFGRPHKEEPEATRQFNAKMLEESGAKADAVEAKIQVQFKALLQAEQAKKR